MTGNHSAPALSPEAKRALLAKLLEERTARSEADLRPLSFAQERLWFFDALVPGSSAYNIHTAIRMRGELQVGALELAVQEIVRRHEVLRAIFPSEAGAPQQVITSAPFPPLAVRDVSGAGADREAIVRRLSDEQAEQPFDLARGPLLKVALLRLSAAEHVLLVTMHHIVSDGWSVGVFLSELTAIYEAFSRGARSPMPGLVLQYPAFARSQRLGAGGALLERQLAYWKERLAGAPASLNLPTDRPRPASQSYRGGTVSALLPLALVDRVKALARHDGATLFMAMLAAFQIVLSRRSGQDDLVVGTPVSGRAAADTEPMIGCFINTLVIRTDLSGAPTFRELLGRVRDAALGAFAHADLPFDRLVEELQPERDLARNPLYQAMFNLLSLRNMKVPEIPGLELGFLPPRDEPAKLDVTLYAIEEPSGVGLRLVYAADLFDQAAMVELLDQFQWVVEQVTAHPDRSIGEVSLVTPAARMRLPDPSIALPERVIAPVTEMFEAHAHRHPDHAALIEDGRSCSYGELSEWIDGVARGLIAAGVRPGNVVAVAALPDMALIAGVLGIMRARAVLLLLDPALPAERRRLMASESGVRHVLQTSIEPGASTMAAALGVESQIDGSRAAAARAHGAAAGAAALPAPLPDDPAYVFFTSGTTGIPKAVVGVHKGLAHFVSWQRDTFGVGPGDRVAQVTGLSFDVVLREIFLPLVSGAALCLRPRNVVDDLAADRVLPWMEREGITTLHTVPSLAQSWLSALPAGVALAAMRRVFFAGEPLSGRLVARWRAAFPAGAEIINLYGPTETTLAKCYYRVPAEPGDGTQPVGRPLPETQALVLTRARTLCGIGERGEIVIRTPYRTQGYRNAPDEQRRLFVANPWRQDAGDRLYLTGDMGRYRLDGELEILGRMDHQVKVRGVRIELGEIERTLTGHPAVAQAVVVVSNEHGDGPRLIAYCVTRPPAPPASEIQAWIRTRLPEAMVPAFVMVLDRLPLTANGKVDRRSLPAPIATEPDHASADLGPMTPVEEAVADIWRALLRVDKVGLHSNFFEMGGHSLLATQLVSRVRESFGIDLPLRRLFDAPTVAGLALAVTQCLLDEDEAPDGATLTEGTRAHQDGAGVRTEDE